MDVPVYKEDQLTGGYNQHCYVYDLEGKPCKRCGKTIIKDEISSRKTFYCDRCQS
ncbi:zinc finger domain-containing protein [Halalkalibacter flavus]|uniref:zinc finger domain-containing protein n=1 Tax=Halalkalibacter flavus TaxID=3090668 RepID=UPI003D66F133